MTDARCLHNHKNRFAATLKAIESIVYTIRSFGTNVYTEHTSTLALGNFITRYEIYHYGCNEQVRDVGELIVKSNKVILNPKNTPEWGRDNYIKTYDCVLNFYGVPHLVRRMIHIKYQSTRYGRISRTRINTERVKRPRDACNEYYRFD